MDTQRLELLTQMTDRAFGKDFRMALGFTQCGIADALGRVAWDLRLQERGKESLEYAKRAIDICRKNKTATNIKG